MESIRFNDPAWRTTFPHRVTPLQDEWLPGLFLRCDEVNSWGSGMTYVYADARSSQFIVAPVPSYMEPLAELLAIPQGLLLKTLYHLELARLYETLKPSAKYLPFPWYFRFCPQCITETRLLPRTLLFPQVTCCPHHGLELCHTCPCGAPVDLFRLECEPFVCSACRLHWTRFPRLEVTHKQIDQAQRYFNYYRFFLVQGTRKLIASALIVMYERWLMTDEMKQWFTLHQTQCTTETLSVEAISLPMLISALVTFDVALSDIEKVQPTPQPRCSHWRRLFRSFLIETYAQTISGRRWGMYR